MTRVSRLSLLICSPRLERALHELALWPGRELRKHRGKALPRRLGVGRELLDERTDRHQRVGRARARDELLGELSERAHLDVAVLVASEHVLKRLQRAHEPRHDACVKELRGEQLEQVAELLALLAKLVVCGGWAALIDRAPVAHDRSVDPQDALAGELLDGLAGARPRAPGSTRELLHQLTEARAQLERAC